MSRPWFATYLVILANACALAAPADLAAGLRKGGYVLVMRHAHAPEALPSTADADPANTEHQRQLDQQGRDSAAAMGAALKRLGIPIGPVYSSPTYRALETVRLLGIGAAEAVPQLGDQGHSMMRIAGAAPTVWLKQKTAELPPPGHNALIITHMPNIVAAFPEEAGELGDGEALVFQPDGHGSTTLVTQVPIAEWPGMSR